MLIVDPHISAHRMSTYVYVHASAEYKCCRHLVHHDEAQTYVCKTGHKLKSLYTVYSMCENVIKYRLDTETEGSM